MTADTEESAYHCLDALNIRSYFDYVGCDNGVLRPKPHPDMLREFCYDYQLSPEAVAVVGDTHNDIRFAYFFGCVSVGVLSGVSNREDFYDEADYILDSVKDIEQIV